MAIPDRWRPTGHQVESGQSWVYQVRSVDGPDGLLYALKRLKNPRRRGRFARELRVMDMLGRERPGVVAPIVDHDLDVDRPWFVMPWYEGGSLQEAVDDKRFQLDPAAGVSMLIRVAELLAEIHAVDLAHRDVKPGNVLVGKSGIVVSDFGLCLELDDQNDRLTETREGVGSRHYIAPENEAGINLTQDQRPADFYAFAKLAWALLAGREPLPREQVREPESRLARTLSDRRLAPIDGLLRDLLNPDPRARLADWRPVLDELQFVQRDLTVTEETADILQPSQQALTIAGSVSSSAAVQASLQRRAAQREEEAWVRRLMDQMYDQARAVELPLGDLNRELAPLLTMVVTTGGGASIQQLSGVGSMDERFLIPPLSNGSSNTAICFLIHSQQAIEAFPTIVIRVWPAFDGETMSLLRLPMIAVHGQPEAVAIFLIPWFRTVVGPLFPWRDSTIAAATSLIGDTGALFISLVEHYVEIIGAGDNAADPECWRTRTLRPSV